MLLEEGDVPSPGAKLQQYEDFGQCEVCYSDDKPFTPSINRSQARIAGSWYLLFGTGHEIGAYILRRRRGADMG